MQDVQGAARQREALAHNEKAPAWAEALRLEFKEFSTIFREELRSQLSVTLEVLSEREQMIMQSVWQAALHQKSNGHMVCDSSGNWQLPLPPGTPPRMDAEGRSRTSMTSPGGKALNQPINYGRNNGYADHLEIEAPSLPDSKRARRKNSILREGQGTKPQDELEAEAREQGSAWRPSLRQNRQSLDMPGGYASDNTAVDSLRSDDSDYTPEYLKIASKGYVPKNNKQGIVMMGNRAPPPLPPLPNSANQLPGSNEDEFPMASADHAAGQQHAGDCAAGDLAAGDHAGGDRAAGVSHLPVRDTPDVTEVMKPTARYDSEVEEVIDMTENVIQTEDPEDNDQDPTRTSVLSMRSQKTNSTIGTSNRRHTVNSVRSEYVEKRHLMKTRTKTKDLRRMITLTESRPSEDQRQREAAEKMRGQKRRRSHTMLKAKTTMIVQAPIIIEKGHLIYGSIQWLVASDYFDYFIGLLLMGNAITIGWQVDYMARNHLAQPPHGFLAIEATFCALFVIEMTLRIIIYRSQFFCMKGWQWNLFDFCVVCLQIAEALTSIVTLSAGKEGGSARSALEGVGLLRTLRLGRVIRLVRMVRLIPELKSMVYLIAASMWSFFWTIMLLLLLMYGVAVYFTDIVSSYRLENGDSSNSQAILPALDDSWGTVVDSILSLYQAILGGVDWKDLMDPLKDEVSAVSVLVFSLYIAFTTLVMLNLVTGVFVEGAQRIIREDKDSELVKQVRKMFAMSDTDEDREVTWEEFEQMMDDQKLDEYFKAVDLSRQEAKDLFKLLDNDNSGSLSAEEFVQGCLRLRGPARSVDLATLIYNYKNNARRSLDHLISIEQTVHRLGKIEQTLLEASDALLRQASQSQ